MKKIITALLTATLLLSPVGNLVLQDHTTVEAKGFKSGKRSFNMQNNKPSNFQNKQKQETPKTNTTKQQTTPKGGFFSGGLMKGLMIGGLAGLLFGGLIANLGALGPIVGLLINIAAIMLLISIIRKVFVALSQQREREDTGPWGR